MTEEKIQGLTLHQVEENRRKYGENILTPPARESLWKKFLEKFEDPIIRILLIAWALSMVISCVHCWGPEQAGFSAFLEPIGIFFAIVLFVATLVFLKTMGLLMAILTIVGIFFFPI